MNPHTDGDDDKGSSLDKARQSSRLAVILALMCAAVILCGVIFAIAAASAKAVSPDRRLVFTPETFSAPVEIPRSAGDGPPAVSLDDDSLNFWSDYPADILADALIARMTDEEICAQVLMFGWAGAEPSDLLNYWVLDRGLGNVKIFGWNTDDTTLVARAVNSLQQKAQSGRFKIPLFVATDQEGGWIRHVKGNTTITPGNMAIGASGYPVDAWMSGYYIARELRALGINMNFAPTVDLYTNFDSSVIGPRSFGDNADFAGILGSSFAAGCLAAGVLPTAKHFPGHGDTGIDSHGNLPIIDIDAATLYSRELVPFKYLIAEKIPAIMSAHLSFPRIEPLGAPSSLSKKILTDMLRGDLGFEGLIITDDIMMNGAAVYAGSVSAAGLPNGKSSSAALTRQKAIFPRWAR
ncbi:MAG: hypothetical protein Pg6C_08170 [Treponemataceae bacterium]|nr:MAG: hypothetical protein Pg6C_08170 [Treponemataceae bacterium]